jgi:hypothetical protein
VSDIVWASNAMINPAMLRLISYAFPGKDYEESVDIGIPCGLQNNAGESLGADCFAPEIYVRKHANTNYEKLPHLFFAGSYWVVSGAVADVMRGFDLGGGNLYPTKVFRKDRKTPIGDEWFCLNFGNVKKAYVRGGVDPTPYIKMPYIRHRPPTILNDNDYTLDTEALVGPDIWVDPQIVETFFLSDSLSKALKAAGVAGPFGLKKCRVGEPINGISEQAA